MEEKNEIPDGLRRCDPNALVAQIGKQNIMAITGGRVEKRETGVTLPVRHDYSVKVDLAGNDTYTVKRVYNGEVKGEEENVYAPEVGDSAYRASCYRDPFGGHKE